MPRLTLLLPAYNEGEALIQWVRQALDTLPALLAPWGYQVRVLVVDDGSSDGSGDALAAWADNKPDNAFLLVRHPQNKGLGAALQTGFQTILNNPFNEAPHPDDVVVTMDADGTHPLEVMATMCPLITQQQADVVIASRYCQSSQCVGVPAYRMALSYAARWVFRLLLSIPHVNDYTCGYRMMRQSVLAKALEVYQYRLIEETGFTCMAELLYKLHQQGARCHEVPFALRYDFKQSPSKLRLFQTVSRSLRLAFRLSAGF